MWVLFCFEKPFEIIVDSRSVSRMNTERSWVPLPRVSWWWHLINYGIVLPAPPPGRWQPYGPDATRFHHRRAPRAAFHGHTHSAPSGPWQPYSALPAILSFPSRSRSSVTTVYVTFPQCRSLEICPSCCVCPKSVPFHCWVVLVVGRFV